MDRISDIFTRCRRQDRAALIIFTSCGYPAPGEDEKAIDAAIAAGADIIELGVPFSDPMADGPVICEASRRALLAGTTLDQVLATAKRIRERHPETGLILFSYMNVMFNRGLETLCAELEKVGVDGVLAVDLPLEERSELLDPCRRHHLHLIPLVAPETPDSRAGEIVSAATGFVYCVSRNGVTGASRTLPPELQDHLTRLKALSPAPVAAGFGVADAKTAREVARSADGVIVGSAFVRALDHLEQAKALVSELAAAVKR